MITDDEKVELITALSEVILERLLLKNPPKTMKDYRERNQLAGPIIGRVMAAVVHEGELSDRYLELSRGCEAKGLEMTNSAQSTARKTVLRLIQGGL